MQLADLLKRNAYLAAMVCAVAACSSTSDRPAGGDAATPDVLLVDASVAAGSCPSALDAPAAAVPDLDFYLRNAEGTQFVMISLREDGLPGLAACDAASESACAPRDASMKLRQERNLKQIDCLSEYVGGFGDDKPVTLWYDEPFHFVDGHPLSVALAFSAFLNASQIQQLSRHPYVRSIESVPGEAAFVGLPAPPARAECPENDDAAKADQKASDASSIRGQGRRPVIVDLKDQELLAQLSSDPSADNTNVVLERAIASRRNQTCVLRALDSLVVGKPFKVSYNSAIEGGTLKVPPLGDSASVTRSFGIGLTWEEALLLAAHPFVERIWTFDGLVQAPDSGCEAQDEGVSMGESCGPAREAVDGKISERDRQAWNGTSDAHRVLISMKLELPLCAFAPCPSGEASCPARDKVIADRQNAYAVSQQCVKALIAELGGAVEGGDQLWLTNAFAANLTWEQITAVAAHPDVRLVESVSGGSAAPPP